jgi:hypothetical protein
MITRTSSLSRLSALALATAALLSACGGGGTENADARQFAGQIARMHPMSAADREAPQALTISQVDAKALFDWAEYKLPTLFPKGPQNLPPLVFDGAVYTVRAYPNGNFLGLRSDGAVFGLGPFTGNVLTPFGRLADYAAAVVAEQCQVNPASCGPSNEPTGPVNECTMPAAMALTPGNRLILNYISYTTSPASLTGEYSLDGIVVGAATFEGQSAIRLDSTIRGTGTEFGVTGTFEGTNKNYSQVAQNGLTRELGGESETTFSGAGQSFQTRSKFVINAGGLNSEFALQLGQSFSKQVTITTTTLAPFPSGPTTGSTTETITFEAKESVAVQAGTFSTCRYRETSSEGTSTLNWFIVGKGVLVKSQTTVGGSTQTQELRSGTFNGGPL